VPGHVQPSSPHRNPILRLANPARVHGRGRNVLLRTRGYQEVKSLELVICDTAGEFRDGGEKC
jgi:hypothetical protein